MILEQNISYVKNPKRHKFLQIAVCAGFILGIICSLELWFPIVRTFPRVPAFFESPVLIDQLLTIILLISLTLISFSIRVKVFLYLAIISLILLIIFDQTRLQPWVYQYLLLLIIFASQTKDQSSQTLSFSQIIIAGLYFWSGVQKMNYLFYHETLPVLLTPLQNIFPSVPLPFFVLGIGIALIESSIGCGLLFRKTRNFAVCLAVGMHILILSFLIAKDFNNIVWSWNAILIILVITLFWQNKDSITDTIYTKNFVAKVATLTFIIMPALSYVGLWDVYLSGALYSGNVEVAVIKINDELYEKLPIKAQRSVFQTKTTNEKILPLFEWSMSELNVPVIPETRVSKQIAKEICKLTEDKNQVKLIIKGRPSVFDGVFNLERLSCAELENP